MTLAAVAPVYRQARRWGGVARLADPKITLASLSSLLLGTAAAARQGALDWGWLALTVAGIFCVETAKNAYLVQRGTLADPALAMLSVGLGALVRAFLLANEFPDARAASWLRRRGRWRRSC
jgi:hypothetical protein